MIDFLDILDGAEVLSESGDCAVKGLDYDSRRVQPSWLFVAMRGESTDGNRYIDAAIAGGPLPWSPIAPKKLPATVWRGHRATWAARSGPLERKLL